MFCVKSISRLDFRDNRHFGGIIVNLNNKLKLKNIFVAFFLLALAGCVNLAPDSTGHKTNLEPSSKNKQAQMIPSGCNLGFSVLQSAVLHDVPKIDLKLEEPQVKKWLTFYRRPKEKSLLRGIQNGSAMKEQIGKVLLAHQVPPEFFYLALLESSFVMQAKSSKAAVGPWQFIATTARLYGLKINRWVDERKDPLKSTIAAAAYLKNLFKKFGDWHLAIAAYNAGPGKIQKAISYSKATDFWALSKTKYLSKETKTFVPRVLAAIAVGETLVLARQEVAQTRCAVEVGFSTKLHDIGQMVDLSVEELLKLNPELSFSQAPPKDACTMGKYQLWLPPQALPQFMSKIGTLTDRQARIHQS